MSGIAPAAGLPGADPLRAIGLKLGAVLCFVILQIVVKLMAGAVPAGQIVFFRSLFALPVLVAWLAWRGELSTGFRARRPSAHVWRGVMGTLAMGLSFAGLGLLPLPEVTAISYATPLLVVVFAAMFLGERVDLFRMATVLLGLGGVLIVLAPRMTGFGDGPASPETLGAILVLASAFCAALAQVFVRRMVRTEAASAIVFWFSLTGAGLSLTTLAFGWIVPGPATALLLVSGGLVGGLGQILLTSAYRHADASLIAPFDYASMLLALAAGHFLFAEVPTATMLGGAAVIILAGVLIIWRERQLQIRRGRARAAGAGRPG